ncbi:MAG: Gfo/Idh/MocA family oxidoreductase [Candidatus Dadabacteria bacterium]|nr:Gfo/Idh/MocA family oxidoreductase [Candidatus Dadabacteria bacterium]
MPNGANVVKLGIVGCGRVSVNHHLPALKKLPGVEVIALADTDKGCLNWAGDRFHINKRYTDYRFLLDSPSLDAVAVCVPPKSHVEIALGALAAGKHLFIEKPLALNLEECDRLIERARNAKTKAMVGFNLRHHRLVRQARQIIQQGTLGDIESIHTSLTSALRLRLKVPEWRNQRSSGGGALFEVAVHHFDLWRYLSGCEAEEVFAMSRADNWDDETVTLTARMTNGVPIASNFSERTSESNELEIYGRKGRLRLSLYDFYGFEFYPATITPGGIRPRIVKAYKMLKDFPEAFSVMLNGGDFLMTYHSEWQYFIDSIQNDTKIECTLEEGRRALQIALAAIESSSLGKPVRVDHSSP